MKVLALALTLALAGCITDQDARVLDGYYNRADIDAINAEVQCKAMARTLVQIARCEVRR
jgi:hypothetical protein